MTSENTMPNTIDLSTFQVRSVSARMNPCELAPGGYSVDVTLTLPDAQDPAKDCVSREGWLLKEGFTDRCVADGAKRILLYMLAYEIDKRLAINGTSVDPHTPAGFVDNSWIARGGMST